MFYLGPPTARQKFFICLLISVLILVLANCETKTSQASGGSCSTCHSLPLPFDLLEIRPGLLDSSQLVPGTFCRFFLCCSVCVCVRLCVYFMFVLARYTSVSCRSAFPYLQFPGAVSLLSFSNPQYTYIGPA